jgi:hypothetical protein
MIAIASAMSAMSPPDCNVWRASSSELIYIPGMRFQAAIERLSPKSVDLSKKQPRSGSVQIEQTTIERALV